MQTNAEPGCGPLLPEFLQPLVNQLQAHPYLFLFIGMLFVGELVLLPSIYLAVTERLALPNVIAVAIAATMISDFAWYYSGRKFPATALQRLPGNSARQLVSGLDKLFDRRGPQVLFLSKFVYGSRVLAQILAGIHDMPLRVYLVANTLGVAALTLVLSGIAWSVTGTARRYAEIVDSVETAFFIFILVAILGYVIAATVARRRWSQ